MSATLQKRTQQCIARLQSFVDREWYPPLLGLLAAVDALVVVIPSDGILISSSMLKPRRWFVLALFMAAGSTLGAVALAYLVRSKGIPYLLDLYPGIAQTPVWAWTDAFFARYGLLLVFAVSLSPVVHQPAVILACLSDTPLSVLAAVILSGRMIKFMTLSYLGSHTPSLLRRIWGLQGELSDAGVKLD